MEKIYSFTNEFVRAYPEMYDFNDAKVLSVLGSGDQYFTAILSGAKEVEVIDVNIVSWYHFVLKYTAIRLLSYEEFCNYFITNRLNDTKIYAHIRNYLPDDVRKFFDNLIRLRIKFSNIRLRSNIFSLFTLSDYVRYIPYLEKENYYKLQSMLNNRKLPTFYLKSFVDLEKSSYDVMLLSNIYHWIDITPEEFKKLIGGFDASEVQALYTWKISYDFENFRNLGFDITSVPPVNRNEFSQENYVLTYKRSK